MKFARWLNILLSTNAILAIAVGIAFALYGPLVMAFFGIPEIPEENVLLYWNIASFARLFGAVLFGLGFLTWAVRSLPGDLALPVEARRGILFALLIANTMGLFVAVTQQVSIWNSTAGWVMVGIFAVLTLAYGLAIFRGRSLAS